MTNHTQGYGIAPPPPDWLRQGLEAEARAALAEPKPDSPTPNLQAPTLEQPTPYVGLFTVRTGNQWIEEAKTRPIPKMLFDVLWYEGEICILFAGSNQGKSILAVQIGDSISRGVAIVGFQLEANKQPVLYFDFELSDKQFETRYSDNYTGHYTFDEGFLRVEMNGDADTPANAAAFDELIIQSMEEAVLQYGAKVLVIDNLTFLRSTEAENAKEASPLMKQLKALKKKYDLSMLILAHTPKRDQCRPLTQNDLQGSSRLMQFADSSFAIGASARDNGLKYLKQIKVRNTAFVFDSDNVALCQIHKPTNFLQLGFVGFGNEQEHLKANTDKDTQGRKERAQELKSKGFNNSYIARELGISEGAVRKYFKS
jgi:hypothetical protein